MTSLTRFLVVSFQGILISIFGARFMYFIYIKLYLLLTVVVPKSCDCAIFSPNTESAS